MNIMHTGDWHLGKTIEGHSRLPEQELFLNDLVSICEEKQPDMIIIAGDIYDTFNPPAAAEQLFYSAVKKLSRNGDCMVIVIAGNHDNPERLTVAASEPTYIYYILIYFLSQCEFSKNSSTSPGSFFSFKTVSSNTIFSPGFKVVSFIFFFGIFPS